MDGGLILSGDARSDSPGHCAKYNSYTMLESRINHVIDMQLVRVHSEKVVIFCMLMYYLLTLNLSLLQHMFLHVLMFML